MIKSFKGKETEKIWQGQFSKKLPPFIQKRALRKLNFLDSAKKLEDLMIPPSNQLEALSRDRKGQQSIRINDQWRICFVWDDGNAKEVEIVDYH